MAKSTNDLIFEKLSDTTGDTVVDKLFNYYKANSGSLNPETMSDAERDFLLTQTGQSSGHVSDLWKLYYTSEGVSDYHGFWENFNNLDFSFGSIGSDEGFLQLDFNQGAYKIPALGSDVIVPGDWSTSSSNGNISVVDGVLIVEAVSGNTISTQDSAVSGTAYYYEISVSTSDAANVVFREGANIIESGMSDGTSRTGFHIFGGTSVEIRNTAVGTTAEITLTLYPISTIEGEQTTAPKSNVFVNADLIGDGFIEINSSNTPEAFGSNVLPFAKVDGSTGLALRKSVTRRVETDLDDWSTINLSPTSAPDFGALKAYDATATVAGQSRWQRTSISFVSGQTETFSVFVDVSNSDATSFLLHMADGTSIFRATFDVSGSSPGTPTETPGTWTDTSAGSIDVGGGWFLLYMIGAPANTANGNCRIYADFDTTSGSVRAAGPHLTATDYLPGIVGGVQSSVGITRTEHTLNLVERIRSAVAACDDTITIAGRFNLRDTGTTHCLLDIADGTQSSDNRLTLNVLSAGQLRLNIGDGAGSTDLTMNFSSSTFDEWHTFALTVSSTSVRVSIDGATTETDTSTETLDLSSVDLVRVGKTRSGASTVQGEISHLVITDQFASAADLEAWSPTS